MSKAEFEEVIQLIIKSNPVRYGVKKYQQSPQKKFKLVQAALDDMGVHTDVLSVRQRRYLKQKGSVTNGSNYLQLTYEYQYQVMIDYKNIPKIYKTRAAAKSRIVREYINRKTLEYAEI